MKLYVVFGLILATTFGVIFAIAQEMPTFNERLAVAGIAGLAQAFGFILLAKFLRERGQRRG